MIERREGERNYRPTTTQPEYETDDQAQRMDNLRLSAIGKENINFGTIMWIKIEQNGTQENDEFEN